MKLRLFLWLWCVCLIFPGLKTAEAQNTSNKGTDFWVGYGNHVSGYKPFPTQQMALYVTSDVSTSFTVAVGGIGYTQDFTVNANAVTVVDVPQAAYLSGAGRYDLGIHLTSADPVVVYSHIYDSSVSGATLVLPTAALGREYTSINCRQVSNEEKSYSYFFVIAVEDDTQVEINPAAETQNGWSAGSKHVISLNKGQVYQVLGVNTDSAQIGYDRQGRPLYKYFGVDLTGSEIRSVSTTSDPCKKIAVFSGSGKVAIGCSSDDRNITSDNLFQQVYPTVSWGKRYLTVPLASRNYDVYRVIKSDVSARVKVNGTLVNDNSFVNGLYYEFSSQATNLIESDKPVQVVQYAVTQNKTINCSDIAEPAGDPEMIFLNPVDATLTNITMYSTDRYRITSQFINVVTTSRGAADFTVDGAARGLYFLPVPGLPGYMYAQIPVSGGTHTLLSSEGFNAIAYGFGLAESYGYAAGANIRALNVEVSSKQNKQVVLSGCTTGIYNLRANLEYKAAKLTWDAGDGSGPVEINDPVADSAFTEDGRQHYIYKLNKDILYARPDKYVVSLHVKKEVSDECGSEELINFYFTVDDAPLADFSSASSGCMNASAWFKPVSPVSASLIARWYWDFGDGTTAVSESADSVSHVYTAPGDFNVKFFLETVSGCRSDVSEKRVHISGLPVAGFSADSPACMNQAVHFSDGSRAAEGAIIRRIWNFNDPGSSENNTSDQKDPSHIFMEAGTYLVSLIVISDKGCSDTLSKSIRIYPLPAADFSMPGYCLTDVNAVFTNKSAPADDMALTYEWDFGDPGSGALNFSAEKDPSHVYRATGTYAVRLKVTSASGCSVIKERRFTVNGSDPHAAFTVESPGALCSNNPVVFRDESLISSGRIIRTEWFFDESDHAGDPAYHLLVEDSAQLAERKYRFTYPVFHDVAGRRVTVRIRVFSGAACFDEFSDIIVLKGVPEIKFDQPAAVCANTPAFKLLAAEISSFPGRGAFSGSTPALSADGLFDPAKAGPGSHTVTYTFTGTNGCMVSESRTLNIYTVPQVNAGENLRILAGGETVIKAAASGNELKYYWSPAAGLNRTDILNPVASPQADTHYVLKAISADGCEASDDVFISVLKSPEIPNTFTPNGDGLNDYWHINYLDTYPGLTMEIFNRYGEKVYYSTGYRQPWDGRQGNKDLPAGTYYYVINPQNGRKVISGSVTIIR